MTGWTGPDRSHPTAPDRSDRTGPVGPHRTAPDRSDPPDRAVPLRALEHLDRCLALGHDRAWTHVRRASVLISLEMMPEAPAALDTARQRASCHE
ncbi:hypothetical protein ACIQMR_21690 [Streptomyces sp. NPDC091376]|uniref:hypothetical protein n=1 Tax=Streptomyces sp. NPDC091376 TaxID=3365994 RepID=UPI003824DA86